MMTAAGTTPFPGDTYKEILKKTCDGHVDYEHPLLVDKPANGSRRLTAVINLLKGLLASSLRDRLSAYEALRLPIFGKGKSIKIGLIPVEEGDYDEIVE